MKKRVFELVAGLVIVMLSTLSINAMPSYDDVLVVVNDKSPASLEIGEYFKTARHISDINVCHISVTQALGTGTRMTNDEKWVALDVIKNHLINNNLTDKINYIVLTHGIPKYAYTGTRGPNYSGTEIDLYHLFDVFLMYQLSESAVDTSIPNIFTNNKYYYYNVDSFFEMKFYADASAGQNYADLKEASYLNAGDSVTLSNGVNSNMFTVASVENKSDYYRVYFTFNTYYSYTTVNGTAKFKSDDVPKLNKKFSRNKFGYYIVGRVDGLGTNTVKDMIDSTGAPAYESYKKSVNGKMKLLTLTPYYRQEVIDEINKRGNIEVVSPNPIPPDVWDPTTQHTTLVDNTDSIITLENTFDKVGKDAMFCFLNDVTGGGFKSMFWSWPKGNDYYADGDFVEYYPFIYRGATFLPGSIMMIYRSNPAAYDSHGSSGGVYKMSISTKARTSFVKLDASDMKFRDMTCVEYEPGSKQLWAGTGRNQLDVGMNFDTRCTDDAHRETMRNYGGGIAIYDGETGDIIDWINANDANSPLQNNRVIKIVYDKNSKYMWVAHYKGIQYYDLTAKTWHDIPELQNDYAAAAGIYLDPFDSDKVYFSFYYDSTSTNTKKISSQLAGADTSIFEYSKSSKTVTPYVIDATSNKGLAPQMGKASASSIWVSKGNFIYRYNLTTKSVVEKFDMNTIIPEKISAPANSSSVTIKPVRNVFSIPSEKVVFATVGCDIVYTSDPKYQRKNYIVRIAESASPETTASVVSAINIDSLNTTSTSAAIKYEVRNIAVDPSSDGKSLYMSLSNHTGSPAAVMRSTDGAGATWELFSTDSSTFNSVKEIALDGNGYIYAVRGYRVGQNIAADFQAFGLGAYGGGMVHDNMPYDCQYSYNYTYDGIYAAGNQGQDTDSSWWISSGIRGVSPMEPMMFMLLDGFYMGEARLGTNKCYPANGAGGHVEHMTVFEPKCAPFAPRVDESNLSTIYKDGKIEIPLVSPGLPLTMDGFIPETINSTTVKITDESDQPYAVDSIVYDESSRKIVITGIFVAPARYKVTLKCGVDGIKNVKGASLTNTRPGEFKDEVTYVFGDTVPAEIDLLVTELTWSPTIPVAGQALTVTFKIANAGNAVASAGDSADQKADVYLDGAKLGSVSYDDIAAGGLVVLTYEIPSDKITSGVHVVKIVADADNQIVETDDSEAGNSLEKSFDTNLVAPDLSVTKINFSETPIVGYGLVVVFAIANTGNAIATSPDDLQRADIYLDGTKIDFKTYGDISAGQEITLYYSIPGDKITVGTHTLKIVADAANRIVEVDETDTSNSLEVSFTAKQLFPNLTVSEIKWQPATPVIGQALTLKFKIANTGEIAANAGASADQLADVYFDGVKLGSVTYDNLSIDSWIGLTYEINGAKITAGTHTIKIIADADNKVIEQDDSEANNSREISFVVLVMPDIVPSGLTVTPVEPIKGQNPLISFNVSNAGTGATDGSVCAVLLDGIKVAEVNCPALGVGESASLSLVIGGGELSAGAHKIKIIIDDSNVISESDETNNFIEKTFIVAPGADLEIKDVWSFPQTPVAGKTLQVFCKLNNIGYGPANGDQTVAIYIDNVKVSTTKYSTLAAKTGLTLPFTVDAQYITAGNHTFKVIADSENIISEINKTNNSLEKNIFVTGTGGGGSSVKADFNGRGASDILWQNQQNGTIGTWTGSNSNTWKLLGSADINDWEIVGVGDFNGNGKSDVLWQNKTNGYTGMWESGTTWQGFGAAPRADWEIVGVGDFNGNGKSDILLQNKINGYIGMWESGTTWQGLGGAVPRADWEVVGVGDFNGNGKSDILLQNKINGYVGMWESGTAWQGFGAAPRADWEIAGVGDFNGNGKSDILWQNKTTGHVGMWESGTTWQGFGAAPRVEWEIVGVGDFNGNGKSDVLWQNKNNGYTGMWEGGVNWQAFGAADRNAWKIVNRKNSN